MHYVVDCFLLFVRIKDGFKSEFRFNRVWYCREVCTIPVLKFQKKPNVDRGQWQNPGSSPIHTIFIMIYSLQ